MDNALARRWRLATLASIALLACIVGSWQLTPSLGIEGALLAVLFCLPILVPLPGLWRGKRYTYKWATFCVLPYFIVGATEAIANIRTRAWAAAMLIAALAWFVALIAYLRVTSTQGASAQLNLNRNQ